MTWDEVRKADRADVITGRRLGEQMEKWNMEEASYLCEICNPMEESRSDEFFVKKVLEIAG